MPLAKVNNVSFEVGVLGRFLNYGRLEVTSASDENLIIDETEGTARFRDFREDQATMWAGIVRGDGLSAASRDALVTPQLPIRSAHQFPSLREDTDSRGIRRDRSTRLNPAVTPARQSGQIQRDRILQVRRAPSDPGSHRLFSGR